MTKRPLDDARRSDERVVQMLKRYVHDQRAPAAIHTETARPLQERLSSARASL